MIRTHLRQPPAVFVDVDGALINRAGQRNESLIAWLEYVKRNRYRVNLWSCRGAQYSRAIAEQVDVAELFDAILDKPYAVVDDKGMQWFRDYVRVYSPEQIDSFVADFAHENAS